MLNQLFQAMIVYIRLCFFKGSPASLPYSHLQLMLVMGVYLFMRVVALGSGLKIEWTDKIVIGVTSLILPAIFMHVLLTFNQKKNRFHKLFSSMLGVGIVVSLILYLLELISPNSQIPASLVMVIALWALFIDGSIFAKGLELKLSKGVLLAFAMACFSGIFQLLIVFSLTAAQAPIK
ncbi:MAG: hypothetical protein AB7D28_04290 [Candidatus Berkiella sp.]|jgi:hypothetical protein